jgi:hypothetical protein
VLAQEIRRGEMQRVEGADRRGKRPKRTGKDGRYQLEPREPAEEEVALRLGVGASCSFYLRPMSTERYATNYL